MSSRRSSSGSGSPRAKRSSTELRKKADIQTKPLPKVPPKKTFRQKRKTDESSAPSPVRMSSTDLKKSQPSNRQPPKLSPKNPKAQQTQDNRSP